MLIRSSELVANPGKSGALGPKVAEMRDVLSKTTGADWWAWLAFAGRPYGTFGLSTRHTDYAEMVAGLMQVGAAPGWAELTASVDGLLAHPADSQLAEVIAVTGEATAPKQFVTVTSATLNGKDIGAAIAWSCDVMEHVTKLTGHGGVVATSAAGTMFRVAWIAGVDTAEELEASNKAIGGDAGYLEMIAQAGTERWFVEGSTDRVLLARMP